MDHDVHPVKRTVHPFTISDITKKESELGIMGQGEFLSHLELFQLIAAKNHNLPEGRFPQNSPEKFPPEGTGTTGDQ
jgi:hypothetical protein